MYPKAIGIAFDMLVQSQGALEIKMLAGTSVLSIQGKCGTYEEAKKRIVGRTIKNPVTTLIGLSRAFWNLPPPKNAVFPVKY